MELVDKWETEDKINDGNCNNIARYFELFEEHISPKSNALITIVELKRLFQETLESGRLSHEGAQASERS